MISTKKNDKIKTIQFCLVILVSRYVKAWRVPIDKRHWIYDCSTEVGDFEALSKYLLHLIRIFMIKYFSIETFLNCILWCHFKLLYSKISIMIKCLKSSIIIWSKHFKIKKTESCENVHNLHSHGLMHHFWFGEIRLTSRLIYIFKWPFPQLNENFGF